MKAIRIIMDDKAKADKGAVSYSKALIRKFESNKIEYMTSSMSPYMLSQEMKPYILIEPSSYELSKPAFLEVQ